MSNRSEFANVLAEKFDVTKKRGDELLTGFTEALREHLATKGEAVLPGFGRLKLVSRQARKGHNPKTGAPIDIPAKHVFKFKPFPGANEEE